MLLNIVWLVLGFVFLIKGADYFVAGSTALAKRMCIPPIVIGLTIVAMGTSAPEAGVSIASALNGSNAIAIGNVLGSNIANIFCILGLCAILSPLAVQKNTVRYEIPFTGAITVLLGWVGMHFGNVSQLWAGIMLGIFALFLVYLFIVSRGTECELPDDKDIGAVKIALFILLGLVALVVGSKITVSSASDIARYIGVSERVIGLTIVAIGTSLPELVTSAVAARHGQTDIAIGNIVGSNIFNILFVLGIAGLILPIPFNPAFWFDTLVALLAVVLLWLFTVRHHRLNRGAGVVFVVIYLAYLVMLIAGK